MVDQDGGIGVSHDAGWNVCHGMLDEVFPRDAGLSV